MGIAFPIQHLYWCVFHSDALGSEGDFTTKNGPIEFTAQRLWGHFWNRQSDLPLYRVHRVKYRRIQMTPRLLLCWEAYCRVLADSICQD